MINKFKKVFQFFRDIIELGFDIINRNSDLNIIRLEGLIGLKFL